MISAHDVDCWLVNTGWTGGAYGTGRRMPIKETRALLTAALSGQLDGALSSDVKIEGKAAAIQGSTASNVPSHIPQGGPFQSPPANRGQVQLGSGTVLINGKPAARNGDTATTCHDPSDLPTGTVVAVSTVLIGG